MLASEPPPVQGTNTLQNSHAIFFCFTALLCTPPRILWRRCEPTNRLLAAAARSINGKVQRFDRKTGPNAGRKNLREQLDEWNTQLARTGE